MSAVALCSAHASPGVTTTTLALAFVWSTAHPGRRALVVDADVFGSGILTGLLQAAVPGGGGVVALAAARTAIDARAVVSHAVALDDSPSAPLVLAGVTDSVQARSLATVWSAVIESRRELDDAGIDLLIDVGRRGHQYEPTVLLERADVVAVVMRSNLPSVSASQGALRSLRETRGPGPHTMGVLVGENKPYSAHEIARHFELNPLPVLTWDAATAGFLSLGGERGRHFQRTYLLRAARSLAGDLTARIGAHSPWGGARP